MSASNSLIKLEYGGRYGDGASIADPGHQTKSPFTDREGLWHGGSTIVLEETLPMASRPWRRNVM